MGENFNSKNIIFLFIITLFLLSCKAQEDVKENRNVLYESIDNYVEKRMSKDENPKYLVIYQWNTAKKCDKEILFFTIHEAKMLDNTAEHDYRTFEYKNNVIIIYDKNDRNTNRVFNSYFKTSYQNISHISQGNDHTYYPGAIPVIYVDSRFLTNKEAMEFMDKQHCY